MRLNLTFAFMFISNELIPHWFNQNLELGFVSQQKVTIPKVNSVVKIVFICMWDSDNEQTQDLEKFKSIAEYLKLLPEEYQCINYSDFFGSLTHIPLENPQLTFAVLHNIDYNNILNKNDDLSKNNWLKLGHIKCLASPSMLKISQNAALKKDYWEKLQRLLTY